MVDDQTLRRITFLGRLSKSGGVDNWIVGVSVGREDDDGEKMVACDIWQHTRNGGLGDNEAVPQSLCARLLCFSHAKSTHLLRASKLQDQKWKWED
ncbi:hypothetical protein Droror1_Dr00027581 [Drosera rotundifolia]